MKYTMIQTPV